VAIYEDDILGSKTFSKQGDWEGGKICTGMKHNQQNSTS
jgi:hypothetical protein